MDGGSSTDFSPDGKRLAIASAWLPDITVVDAASGEELFTLRGDSTGTGNVRWSPDGRWIAATGIDATVRIWDAENGEPRFTAIGHDAAVVGLDWSPDATRLATGSEDGTASVSEVSEDGIRELLSFSAGDRSWRARRGGLLARRRAADDGKQRDHRGQDLGCQHDWRRRVGQRARRARGGGVPFGGLHV